MKNLLHKLCETTPPMSIIYLWIYISGIASTTQLYSEIIQFLLDKLRKMWFNEKLSKSSTIYHLSIFFLWFPFPYSLRISWISYVNFIAFSWVSSISLHAFGFVKFFSACEWMLSSPLQRIISFNMIKMICVECVISAKSCWMQIIIEMIVLICW